MAQLCTKLATRKFRDFQNSQRYDLSWQCRMILQVVTVTALTQAGLPVQAVVPCLKPQSADNLFFRHDEAKLISKTRPEKHTKHCVLEKDSLNPLPVRFAK